MKTAERPTSGRIARYLELELLGEDVEVQRPCPLDDLVPGGISFASRATTDALWKLAANPRSVVICPESLARSFEGNRIVSENPRVSFIKMMEHFFSERPVAEVHATAVVADGARIGCGIAIGPHAFIGPEVTIGDRALIGAGVVIEGTTVIGSDCFIKANSVIGGAGFGFDLDDDGTPLHFPHVGGVRIGDHVWIGANTTIERAALTDTVIEDHVKIDDHVQIGHNTFTGRNTRICAGTILCGRVSVQHDSWLSPKVTIIQAKKVGPRSIVGMAANVLSDVPADTVFAGNPARHIRDILPGEFTKLLTAG